MTHKLPEIEECPVIAAVHEPQLDEVTDAPVAVVFLLEANLLTVGDQIKRLHGTGKKVFVHLDLADGIGKDKTGVAYLAGLGVDGIISTKAGIIRTAKEMGLLAVQRFFALDSQGVAATEEMIKTSRPDFAEIMPALATKIIARLSTCGVPIIAGGLLEEKQEALAALSAGAVAVSTGKNTLWYQ